MSINAKIWQDVLLFASCIAASIVMFDFAVWMLGFHPSIRESFTHWWVIVLGYAIGKAERANHA